MWFWLHQPWFIIIQIIYSTSLKGRKILATRDILKSKELILILIYIIHIIFQPITLTLAKPSSTNPAVSLPQSVFTTRTRAADVNDKQGSVCVNWCVQL